MGYPWSTAAHDQITELIGDYPVSQAHARFNTWARKHGEHTRTLNAVCNYMKRLGYSVKPTGAFLQVPAVAQIIGRHRKTIYLWVVNGWIRPEFLAREGSNWLIHRDGLRALATERPILFLGTHPDALFQLLEDRRLVADVLSVSTHHPNRKRPVVCLNDGRRSPSIAHAARHYRVTYQVLRRAVATGKTVVAPMGILDFRPL